MSLGLCAGVDLPEIDPKFPTTLPSSLFPLVLLRPFLRLKGPAEFIIYITARGNHKYRSLQNRQINSEQLLIFLQLESAGEPTNERASKVPIILES